MKCNCKHICKYPILLHNFICICLDFEGIGSIERTNEQDIQMALVGSAIGNNILFRTYSSFDRFTENTLEKIGLGSRKITNIDINDFFGGSLFFCPRDVLESNEDDICKEFNAKIKSSVIKWRNQLNEDYKNEKNQQNNGKKKYTYFGIFASHFFAPTPSNIKKSFYKTLRKDLTPAILENSLKFKRHPIYKTGKEFYENLKTFLVAVYMDNYELLTKFKEEQIREYINSNLEKAYEVGGFYENYEEKQIDKKNYLDNKNKLKIYFNKDYLEKLKINFSYSQKFENNDSLIIDNIYCSADIQNQYNIKKYEIKFDVNKTKENIFSISIKNLNDFSLILKIPILIKDIITYDDLRLDFFKIWESICKEINLNEEYICKNFSLFILSIIKRRINNSNNWVKQITNDFNDLKNMQIQDSRLDNIWTICQDRCKYCYYNCILLQGHDKEHKCPYDHKCKEQCSICKERNCNNNNCSHTCEDKAGHTGKHICTHFHQCKKECKYKDFSINCNGICILEYGHKEEIHSCGILEHDCTTK